MNAGGPNVGGADAEGSVAGRHVLLVGMMGTGKSTVGRQLAGRLGRPFLDVDSRIEARGGQSVASLFATLGEEGFRGLESRVLASVLASPEPSVVACGGGAVLDADNRALLRRSGLVVWLKATPAELSRRLGASSASGQTSPGVARRPLLAGPEPPVKALGRLERQRRTAYRASAHLSVETNARSVSELVDEIAGAMLRPSDQTPPSTR
ncbi:MAG: shikimate kinase [Acidimicrobiia bacterium]